MHLFRNNNEAKSRKSRLLSVALSAALVLGSFSVLSMADTKSEAAPANQVVENTAKVAEAASITPSPTPAMVYCGINTYAYVTHDGRVDIYTTGNAASVTYTGWQGNENIKSVSIHTNESDTVRIKSDNYKGVFQECSSLKTVTVDKCAKIDFEKSDFYGCNALEEMTINASAVSFAGDCLQGIGASIEADIYLPNVNSRNDFSLVPNIPANLYGNLTFHFNNSTIANSLAIDAKDQETAFGNYVCDNGDTPTPEPLKGGMSFSVSSNGSTFGLIFQLKPIEGTLETADPYGGYMGWIGEGDSKQEITFVDGRYCYNFAAKDMTKVFHLKVCYMGVPNDYEFEKDVSVASCLEAIIDYEGTTAEQKDIAKTMLLYGTTAQFFFGEDINNLANSNAGYGFEKIGGAVLSDYVTYNGSEFNTNLNLDYSQYAGIALRFGKELDFYMFFKVKDGIDLTTAENEISNKVSSQVIMNSQNGYVYIKGVASISNLGAPLFTFPVGTNGTIGVGAFDYIKKVLDKEEGYGELKMLCKALYIYSESVA